MLSRFFHAGGGGTLTAVASNALVETLPVADTPMSPTVLRARADSLPAESAAVDRAETSPSASDDHTSGHDAGEALSIHLTGALEVRRGDKSLALPASRKTRALLAYLVLSARPHRRERLCELFWDIPDDPRGALRWSLSKLRRLVDEPGRVRIAADRERVAFVADSVELDVEGDARALRARLDDPDLGRDALLGFAARLERPLLVGLELPRQARFQRWLDGERRARAALLARANERLASEPRPSPEDASHRRHAVGGAVSALASSHRAETETENGRPLARIATLPRRRPASQRLRFCRAADGTRIAHACTGEGPPLVVAPGWPGHLESERSAPLDAPLAEELARGRTLVRHDGRGSGLSDRDVDDFSLEARLGDLECVVDALELGRFALHGASHGAAVSIAYAARHPERVSHLILLGPCAVGWRRGNASPAFVRQQEALVTLASAEWSKPNPAFRHLFSSLFMPSAAPATLAWFDEHQHRAMSGGDAARFLSALGDVDVRARLAELAVPTLIAHARGDQYRSFAHAREIAADVPGAEITALDGDAHVLLGDEPAAAEFVDTARRFLARRVFTRARPDR